MAPGDGDGDAEAEAEAAARAPGAVIAHSLESLEKRLTQMQYAPFAAQGSARGSGSVESANKLVVEARLKGAGLRWARAHVNPLVALRTVACSDRGAEAWPQRPQSTAHWRAQGWRRRRDRTAARRQAAAAAASHREPAPPPVTAPPRPAPVPRPTAPLAPPPGRRGPPGAVLRAVQLRITPGATLRSAGRAVPTVPAETWRAPRCLITGSVFQ